MKSVDNKLDFTGDIIVGLNPIVVLANTTAVNGALYNASSSATFTDPAGVEGLGYEVKVLSGTSSIGGVAYAIAGSVINRVFQGGVWASYLIGSGVGSAGLTSFNGRTASAAVPTAGDYDTFYYTKLQADAAYQAKFGNQSPNLIYAGPVSGAVGLPSFRALALADLPVIAAPTLTNSEIASGDTLQIIANKSQGQIDFLLSAQSIPILLTGVPPFAPIRFETGAPIAYDENYGALNVPSIGAISSIELSSITIGVAGYVAIGLHTDGNLLFICLTGPNVGKIAKIDTSNNTTFPYPDRFPTTALTTSQPTANKLKVTHAANGDIVVGYTLPNNLSFTTWGTATAAQLTLDGVTISSKKMGAVKFASDIFITDYKTLSGLNVIVSQRYKTVTVNTVLDRMYPYINKRVGLMGDSITAETSVATGSYTVPIKNKLLCGTPSKAAAAGGLSLGYAAGATGTMSSDAYIQLATSFNPDVFILMGMMNDYFFGAQPGDPLNIPSTVANPDTGTSATTVGGLRKIIIALKTRFPAIKIFVCTSSPKTGNATLNSAGFNQKKYADVMVDVCQYYSIPCIDLFTTLNWTSVPGDVVINYFTTDGIHPKAGVGYEDLTDRQAKFINSH